MSRCPLDDLARRVLAAARAQGLKICTAESCTGGLVIGKLTDIAGASDVVDRGFVTYSNLAKEQMLGVPARLIAAHGAVSAEVASAMALGALKMAGAGLSVAITGVAGPGGGSAVKPVGLVHFAAATRDGRVRRSEHRFGDTGRASIREKSVETALYMLLDLLEEGERQMA